jgi:hypothetical protein
MIDSKYKYQNNAPLSEIFRMEFGMIVSGIRTERERERERER